MHPVGAERLGREASGQRGVDAAGDADDDLREAVLLDVVPQAELEREPHLLEVVELGRDRAPYGNGAVALDDEQRLLEPGRAGDDLSVGVEDERVPVEDELVLSADGIAEDDRAAVCACALGEHRLALAVLGRRGTATPTG